MQALPYDRADNAVSVNSIHFGLFSAKEIIRQAVCKVDSSKLSGYGTVYDPKMGVVDQGAVCETCFGNNIECPGHFGYIYLNVFLVHPMYIKTIFKLLKHICFECGHLLYSEDELKIRGMIKGSGFVRFNLITKEKESRQRCGRCGEIQPSYMLKDNQIYYFYKIRSNKDILTAEEIYKLLRNLTEEEVKILGFVKNSHPLNMILTVLPVLPPIARPYVLSDIGGTSSKLRTCDDDLTYKYIEIIKINKRLENPKLSETQRSQLVTSLAFHTRTLMDNSQGKAKQPTGRPIKSFKERMSGKDGLMRANIMGKRNDMSARSVISPDPSLCLDEVGVPEQIAQSITIPERVWNGNIDYLTQVVHERKANIIIRKDGRKINLAYALRSHFEAKPDDIIIRQNDGGRVQQFKIEDYESFHHRKFTLQCGDKILRKADVKDKVRGKNKDRRIEIDPFANQRAISLRIGDVVERHLQNGDFVLFNRQPTLHRASMQGLKVKVLPGKTFRLNLSITTPFNADKHHCPQQGA